MAGQGLARLVARACDERACENRILLTADERRIEVVTFGAQHAQQAVGDAHRAPDHSACSGGGGGVLGQGRVTSPSD